jgi:hypothetical protein
VTDYGLGRIQVFDNDGNPLWAWGNDNLRKPLFQRPTAIALDTEHGHFWVVNQQGNIVQIFDLP